MALENTQKKFSHYVNTFKMFIPFSEEQEIFENVGYDPASYQWHALTQTGKMGDLAVAD